MRNEKFASQPVVQVDQDPNWRVHHAIERLKGLIEVSDHELNIFRKSFDQNPVSALEWSMGAFYHANQKRVVESLLEDLQAEPTQETIDELCSELVKDIVKIARITPSSTSAVCNISDNCRRKAYCNVLDYLKAYSSENIIK
jgi:hypothetical protein